MPKKLAQMVNTDYRPNEREEELLELVYGELDKMIDARDKTYTQFNDRTLSAFIDDSDKRLNAYVPSKDSQDKEDWQSNVALPTNRDKLKKLIAGFSLQVPELEVKAFGEYDYLDVDRAEVAKWLIMGSYLQEENPILENFWEAWEAGGKGTVIKYEGYLKTQYKQKFIKSFDLITGKIEFEERLVDVNDECISVQVPLLEFYVRDFYINNVQDQPAIAWVRYYEKDVFERDFSKYANAKYVLAGSLRKNIDTTAFFHKKKWSGRAGEDRIEVVRYYNKIKDMYVIVANGVVLLDSPLLWTVNGKKVYPFAKSIWEPFVGKHFFYGNSLPNVLMGQFDILCTLWNTTMDREFKSLNIPLLIGAINQDAFELESEFIGDSTKIYVEDVAQVTTMPVSSVSSSDIAMIELVARGIAEASPSLPEMMSKRQVTAREIVIAEEKLRDIKSLHHQMLVDLWRQKYALRLANIQLNYPQPRKIVDKKGKEKLLYRTYIVNNAILERDTKERGILAIQFRKIAKAESRKIEEEIAVEERLMKQRGINYKKLILATNYLDNYRYQLEIVPESLYKTSLAKMQSVVLEKLQSIAAYFPEILAVNQEEFFSQLMKAYDENPDKYIEALKKLERAQQILAEQEKAQLAMTKTAEAAPESLKAASKVSEV